MGDHKVVKIVTISAALSAMLSGMMSGSPDAFVSKVARMYGHIAVHNPMVLAPTQYPERV